MMLKRRKRGRLGLRASSVIKCPGHLRWVRGFSCCIADKAGHVCWGRMEAHHSTTRGAGGGDETAVPLCSYAHADGHLIGWTEFEKRYGVDLGSIAAELWRISPHRRKYELSLSGVSRAPSPLNHIKEGH